MVVDENRTSISAAVSFSAVAALGTGGVGAGTLGVDLSGARPELAEAFPTATLGNLAGEAGPELAKAFPLHP